MTAKKNNPKVFISYSWSGSEHEEFVENLVDTLRSHGVDAIFDKYRLKPGQDKYVFMETMVTDPEVVKVLMLCDKKYKEKADARSGGVGTESQIISQELYSQVAQTKFIPIVCERDADGEPYLPVFMKGRIYVDISTDENFGSGLDEIERLIHEQPLKQEPQLGEIPTYLRDDSRGMPIANELSSTLRSIRENKPNQAGLKVLFLRSILAKLKQQYVKPENKAGYDEEIYQAILSTKRLRDQYSEYADTLSMFSSNNIQELKPTIDLLESIGHNFQPEAGSGLYVEGWADLYRFFALEVVLITVASMLRHENWELLRYFLSRSYIVSTTYATQERVDINAFDQPITSIDEHRNNRLKSRRVCLSADILKERCKPDNTSFEELLQADIFLALNGMNLLGSKDQNHYYSYWRPRLTVYGRHSVVSPIFMKAESLDIKQGILKALGVDSSVQLKINLESASAKTQNFRELTFERFSGFNFLKAINIEALLR